MEIIAYPSPLPPRWQIPGSFVDRNPNLCYLAFAGGQGVLIDACSDLDQVFQDIDSRHLHLDALLITHYHDDHTFALADWLEKFPALTVGAPASSLNDLVAAGIGANRLFPLSEGTTVPVGGETLRVLATPGHTKDSLCFWDERGSKLWTGDSIFGGNIGCADYRRGGNRNVFYHTIRNLLKILPITTEIYPGHLSEHYRTVPPYSWDGEKINNPYIANALAGKRGHFDRALKYFSLEFETAVVVMPDDSALDTICELEEEIWIPELQASRELIRERLRNGHRLLTVKEETGWLGMIGWCYSPFSLADGPDLFPHNFQQFSNCKSCCLDNARSAFIYNVGVLPELRRKGAGSLLLQEAFERIRKDGISQVFIDSRMASYNGSAQYLQEKVLPQQIFREAVNRYFSTGQMPSETTLASDSTVNFYIKNGLTPWLIRQDFIPDEPSGNMRVICQANLDQEAPLIDTHASDGE